MPFAILSVTQGWEKPYVASIAGVLAFWFLLVVPSTSHAASPLRLAFDGQTNGEATAIVVSALEPGAEVVLFTVSREVGAFVPRTSSVANLLGDDDKDGEVRIALEHGVPAKFFAVAAELASGRYGVLTPKGSPAREIAFPADSFGQGGPGRRFDRIEDESDLAMILLVRPRDSGDGGGGGGAWSLTTGDGAAADESPASDGVVTTSASSMVPVGKSGPPPEEYEKDDLLVRVAPRASMEYYVARIVR